MVAGIQYEASRYDSSTTGIGDEKITRALTRIVGQPSPITGCVVYTLNQSNITKIQYKQADISYKHVHVKEIKGGYSVHYSYLIILI